MRGRSRIRGLRGGLVGLFVALTWAGVANAEPPPFCDPVVVMTDAEGDGHHASTDVRRAWLSEANGGDLQAVIEVDVGTWQPDHDDPAEVRAAFLFTVNGDGVTRYVRLRGDSDTAIWDHGTWTLAGGFVTQGGTTGDRDTAFGPAAAWIDVPTSVVDDTDVLTNTFVLTYDGSDFVDHAPGGTSPGAPERGPSFVVGECAGVGLNAPGTITGARRVTISGRVFPAAQNVDITITRGKPHATFTTMTDEDGRFSIRMMVREKTTVVAVDEDGLTSLTRTIRVRSKVTIQARELANGKTRITGRTDPALPGRIQLFKTTAFVASITRQIDGGRFQLPAKNLSPGRYEVIYTPSNGRAIRDISNRVRVT
jgi:hypothetical protein